MADLKNIIYLSNEDYETLVTTGTVTIGGDTLTYDETNNVYVTPEETASSTNDGLMSAADKAKLDGISPGAGVDTNQTVKVSSGSVEFGANDSIDFVGTAPITVVGNSTNKTITIGVTTGTTASTVAVGNHNHDSVYLGKTAKAADSDKLDGNDSTYYQKALPTTSTAGKVLKSTSTAGTVEWGDAPAAGVTNVKIGDSSIVDDGVATIQTNSAYDASTNKIATMSDVPSSFTVSVTDDILDGTGGANSVKYAPYSSKGAGHLYTGTTNPSSTNRLNYDGYLYATKLYSNGAEVLTGSHQSIKTLDTTATNPQSTNASEAIAGTGKITLHKVAKTGTYSDLYGLPSLGTAASKDTGTAAGNVPVLDSNGQLSESVIPAVAITDTYVVASESDMLGLSAQKGDIAIRSDLNKSFVLQAAPASTLANWKELLTPTDAVLSVNGKTGAVTLAASDVGASTSSHTHSFTPSGSVTLTNTGSSGTTYVESISSTGASGTPTTRYLHKTTDTFLKGVKASGTASAAPNEHTHTVTATGSVTLSSSDESGQIAYVSSVSGGGASGSGTTKYMHWSAGTTPKSGATPNHESKNTGTATTIIGLTTKYLTVSRGTSGSGTSARRTLTFTPAASSTTTGAAMNMAYIESGTSGTHTHTYDKTTSVSLTAGTAPSLVFNTTASGGQAFLQDYTVTGTAASATTKYLDASFSGTSATTSKNSGNAIAVVTGVTSNGTGSAITDITVNTSPASGDITYLQDYSVSGGGASATTKHLNAIFDGDSDTTGTPQ